LSEKELAGKSSAYTPNWEAYDHFIRGRQMAHEGYFARSSRTSERPSHEFLAPAKELFERTIEFDPQFAGGYAGLSWMYSLGVRHGFSDTSDADKEKAHELAIKAVEIDDAFGWSHTALANANLMLGRQEEAVESANAAVQVQPSDADAQAYFGFCLIWAGRPEQALPYLESALRLDPRFHARSISWIGWAYFGLRRYDDAVRALEQGAGSTGIIIHFNLAYLAASYSRSGRAEDASATIERLLARYPNFDIGKLKNLLLYKSVADTEHVCAAVRVAGLPE
jgi:tetratricopeptide (TPR) repeat protein